MKKERFSARDLAAANAGLANKALRAAVKTGDKKQIARVRNMAQAQVETLRSKTKGWR